MRVCVEARALAEGRFSKLADDLKTSKEETIGILVVLWHDSQEQKVVKGTQEEIEFFLSGSKERQSQVFAALVRNRYVNLCPDGFYQIRGNQKHVDFLQNQATVGSRGGKRSGEVRRKKSNVIKQNEGSASKRKPSSILYSSSLKEKTNTNTCGSDEPPPPADLGFNLKPDPYETEEHPLVSIWNSNRGTLAACKGLGSKDRKKNAEARWREKPNPQYWIEIVRAMAASPFCRGEKNNAQHPHWRADFDFMVRGDNHLKVSEGKYSQGQIRPVMSHHEFAEAEIAAEQASALRRVGAVG